MQQGSFRVTSAVERYASVEATVDFTIRSQEVTVVVGVTVDPRNVGLALTHSRERQSRSRVPLPSYGHSKSAQQFLYSIYR
jgi:hypothetical protein